jgi:hypothetical protein
LKEVRTLKRPDLILLIAIWEFLTGLGGFIGISAIAVFAFPDTLRLWGPALVGGLFGLSIAVLLLLCYTGLAVAGGIGLLYGKEWGRILSIVHAVLSLLWIPIGTIIGVLVLVYLTRTEARDYFSGGGESSA